MLVSMGYVNECEVTLEPDEAWMDEVWSRRSGVMSRSHSSKCQATHHFPLPLSFLFQPLSHYLSLFVKHSPPCTHDQPLPTSLFYLLSLPPALPSCLLCLSLTLFLTHFFLSPVRLLTLVLSFARLSSLTPALTPLSRSISLFSWKRAFPPGREPDSGCFGSGHPHR